MSGGILSELEEMLEGVADVVDGAIFDGDKPNGQVVQGTEGAGNGEVASAVKQVARTPGGTFKPAPKKEPVTPAIEPGGGDAGEPDAKA